MTVRGASGYAMMAGPNGPLWERDTYTCAHCGNVRYIKPLARANETPGRCFSCDKLICVECLRIPRCLPFEEQLKRMEARIDARRSYEECR